MAGVGGISEKLKVPSGRTFPLRFPKNGWPAIEIKVGPTGL
jgi:hypothetical protein